MPLFVAVGYPKLPPLHGSRKEGREIAIEAMKLWEEPIREHLPWFKLEFVEEDPGAPVQIVWKRRIAAGWGGFGGLRYWVRDGRLSVGGGMDISTKPSNVSNQPMTKDRLRLVVAHEFGARYGRR